MGGYAPEFISDKNRKRGFLMHTISVYYTLKVGAYAPESDGFYCLPNMLGAYAPESGARRLFWPVFVLLFCHYESRIDDYQTK